MSKGKKPPVDATHNADNLFECDSELAIAAVDYAGDTQASGSLRAAALAFAAAYHACGVGGGK